MAIAKKVVSRVVGGITGKGSKNVNPVYKNTSDITAGKEKVNRKVEKLNDYADARTGGNLGYVYQKGKLIEKFDNHPPIKVKPRALTKVTKQMAPSNKKTRKIINKVIKSQGEAIKPNAVTFGRVPKVPVKRSK